LVDRDFLHVRPRFVDDFEESGRMIHESRVMVAGKLCNNF
jgi:hypothetical protein